MPDTRDPESVIQAAEQAAVSGDYAAAERLLREAADLQETSLGPLHPELANTLNNLGVVYEVTEKPEQAERCFRRASEIAAAVLPADHPFVATSRQNLEDFLATRAKAALPLVPPPAPTPAPAPVQAPPAAPPPAPSTPPPAVVHPQGDLQEKADRVETAERAAQRSTSDSARAAATQTLSYSTRETTSAVEDRRKPRTMAIGGLLAAGLLVTLIAIGLWFRGGAATQPSSATPLAAPAERPAPVAEPKPSAPTPAVEPRAGAAKEVRRTRARACQKRTRGIEPNKVSGSQKRAGRRRRTTLRESCHQRRRRLAVQSARTSGRSRPTPLLYAPQVSDEHDRPASVVPRRPPAEGGEPRHQHQHRERLSHLQPQHRHGARRVESGAHDTRRRAAPRRTLHRAVTDRDYFSRAGGRSVTGALPKLIRFANRR